MSKIKFTYNKVYNYVKGKPVVELVFEGIAFGILLPLVEIDMSSDILLQMEKKITRNDVLDRIEFYKSTNKL